jgi:ribosomal peptide maturation radical SAM protein 1
MLKIALINPPFADDTIPSIALTQLRSVMENTFGSQVKVGIHYFNHDFSSLIGQEIYQYISSSGASNNSGFGDWFFRQLAFPDLPDNTQKYFNRYGSLMGPQNTDIYNLKLKSIRDRLDEITRTWLDRNGIMDAQIIGFTSMFMQNASSFGMARIIKELNPDAVTIMGGANCETPMGQEIVKNIDAIDYVFSGTALKSFPLFIERYLQKDHHGMTSINGIFSKSNVGALEKKESYVTIGKNGEIQTVGPIGDELPISEKVDLNYTSFLDSYNSNFRNSQIKPYLLFETSRGCWWGAKAHCTFCGLNGGGMTYRAMPKENALELLHTLFDRYAGRVDHFSCVDNILPKEYLKDVLPFLNVPPHVSMFYEVKADLTAEDIKTLARAKVLRIQPGVEALATSTLKLMKKGTSAFMNLKLLMNCATYAIKPSWNLLIGFPGEREEVYEKYAQDIPLLYHLPPPTGVYPVRFDRYSPYFKQAESYQLKLKPLDYYELTYPFSDETLADFAYYFSDQNYDAAYIQNAIRWVEKLSKLVEEWAKKWTDAGNLPSLSLVRDDNGNHSIIDTRYGGKRSYALDELGFEILADLKNHKNREALYNAFRLTSSIEIDDRLNHFFKNKLLFEESGSILSLVLIPETEDPNSMHSASKTDALQHQ